MWKSIVRHLRVIHEEIARSTEDATRSGREGRERLRRDVERSFGQTLPGRSRIGNVHEDPTAADNPLETALLPVADIEVLMKDGSYRPTPALVDTGNTSHLRLPAWMFRRAELLGGPIVSRAELSDGSTVKIEMHKVRIRMLEEAREVYAYFAGRESAIGMEMLRGKELRIEARKGGGVYLD